MKVLVLSPALYDTSPALRFRIEQWGRHLEPAGIRFTFVPFEDKALRDILYQPGSIARKSLLTFRALARRFALLPRVRDFDVVLMHREAAALGPAIIERLIARQRPIVYDFDDPIWLSYRSPTNGIFSYLKWPSKVAAICRLATVVTAGNRLLAGWARSHNQAVEVVPTTIDLDRSPVKPPKKGGLLTLGWTGSHSTLPFLQSVLPVLKEFARRRPFRLSVVSHTDTFDTEGLPVEVQAKKWRAETEAEDLLDMDIGLAPFPNSGWTPWRCHGKVLQYMAAGLPTIASPIGIIPDYIQNGENGFLAGSDDEWIAHLEQLADDPQLRRRIGMAGRETMAREYSIQVWAPRVKEILEKAVSNGRSYSSGSASKHVSNA